jgi:hypothetical protein
LVAESGFKASEESRAKLKELQQTPEFQTALAEQDYGKVLRMSGATQMLSSDVENGAKSIAAAETFDAKKIANQQKQLDLDAQEVGNAYGVLAAVEDDKIDEFVGRLPEPTRKILVDKVGAENWANMSGTEKKEAAKKIAKAAMNGKQGGMEENYEEKDEKMAAMETEINEAMDIISTLKSELNEINLLNSKLLYTNKIFKAKNLTEAQKVKVLTAFDKAETVKEAKLVYETLQEGLEKVVKKELVRENKGFASKAIGSSPKQPVVDTNPMVDRFKKLAGLI